MTYFVYTSVILLQFKCLKITCFNNFKQLFSKTMAEIVVKFHMKLDHTPGSQNCKIGSGRISKLVAVIKNSKNN